MPGSEEAWRAVITFCEVMLQKETAERIRRREAAPPAPAGRQRRSQRAATKRRRKSPRTIGAQSRPPPTHPAPPVRRSQRVRALARGALFPPPTQGS